MLPLLSWRAACADAATAAAAAADYRRQKHHAAADDVVDIIYEHCAIEHASRDKWIHSETVSQCCFNMSPVHRMNTVY